MDNEEIKGFYDKFVKAQQDSGINDRIYGLYIRLKQAGLHTDSNVLELGCGVGTMTFLISKTVKNGQVESVDISTQSIAFCNQKIKAANINFVSGDVVNHRPSCKKIDFITLFDILEHIPMEKHAELFKNLSSICDADTKILINIPNPEYLQYDIEHHPETLQIIDQPLPLNFILQHLNNYNLNLTYFEPYSIWVENDYHFMMATKKTEFREVFLSSKRSFFQKAKKKIQRTLIKIIYNYK